MPRSLHSAIIIMTAGDNNGMVLLLSLSDFLWLDSAAPLGVLCLLLLTTDAAAAASVAWLLFAGGASGKLSLVWL